VVCHLVTAPVLCDEAEVRSPEKDEFSIVMIFSLASKVSWIASDRWIQTSRELGNAPSPGCKSRGSFFSDS